MRHWTLGLVGWGLGLAMAGTSWGQGAEGTGAAAVVRNPAMAAVENALSPVRPTARRDPFQSPLGHGLANTPCSQGKACLDVSQISVKGIVRSESGMVAVVVNPLGRAYFLRENDRVLRGYVKHIGEDAVVFVETAADKLGKPSTREVIRKITTAPAS